MPMLKDPSQKYKPFGQIPITNRQWPNKVLDKAPRWLSTDLRDGNQSLIDPMSGDEKWVYFQTLVECGFKEIEVAFPSASQIDFDFVRKLIETPGAVPDDVFIQVLAPCREELIRRTVDSVKGAKNAIIHIYNATSPCFREVVFNADRTQTLALAERCTKLVREITKDSTDPACQATNWRFEYSPETFSDTEPDFALQVCEAVKAAWEPSTEAPIIFNLPATVEMATPNIYADQIEYFSTHITEREKVCISLHPHNDRGCAVAASELGQMAGADRIEGCLFGNGERTGNVDLVTLALNLYTQGVSPGLDFSDLPRIIKTCCDCNKIPIHPRHPYSGDLVYTAFSGSHQDAIKKGFKLQDSRPYWKVPYMPIDPADLGATYEAVIRVNSQSGKGGVSFIVERELKYDLPRNLQIAFSRVVQGEAERLGRELLPSEIVRLFKGAYGLEDRAIELLQYNVSEIAQASDKERSKRFTGQIRAAGREALKQVHEVEGVGNGPLSSLLDAVTNIFGFDAEIKTYNQQSIGKGNKTTAVCFVEVRRTDSVTEGSIWGVAESHDVTKAGLQAVLNAVAATISQDTKQHMGNESISRKE
ncbi:2-isopropylmalate synthase (Alpha-isopropylmalate synthase) (Alpha-IPM synthetase) [Savitreella phatthalungensis]